MGKADRVLYSSARRLLQAFDNAGIPFTGPAGTDLTCWDLRPVAALQSWFRTKDSAGPSFELGVRLIERMDSQLAVLQASEETTREGFSGWANLMKQHCGAATAVQAAAACEAGMELLRAQIEELTDPLGLDKDFAALQEDVSAAEEDLTFGTASEIAAEVRQRHPALFSGTPTSGDSAERLRALAHVIYRDLKFKYDPFEWVYDGLKPMLLPEVMKKRRGAPAALALLGVAVGRELGVALLPMPAAPIAAGAESDAHAATVTAAAAAHLDSLPPEQAWRIRSKTEQAAVAPGPGPWLLRLAETSGGPGDHTVLEGEESLFLDAGSGEVLGAAQVAERYPAVAHLSAAEWQDHCVLRTWQGLCRVALQAHQRRGESDFVAHWLFMGLALDPVAPEWTRALTAPEVR